MLGKDYSDPGYYFVTICVADYRQLFGRVVNGSMELNGLGRSANRFWLQIPEHFAGVRLGSHQVMPNHIHGLLLLPTQIPGTIVSTSSLGTIIGSYKAAVSKKFLGVDLWQRGFHDRVVRNEEELRCIAHYIRANPENWHCDRYNPAAKNAHEDSLMAEAGGTVSRPYNR